MSGEDLGYIAHWRCARKDPDLVPYSDPQIMHDPAVHHKYPVDHHFLLATRNAQSYHSS